MFKEYENHFSRYIQFSLLLAALIFNFSCKQSGFDRSQTVFVALEQNPKSLDPRFATDAIGQRMDGLLFNALVRVGPNLEIIGDAATRWDYKNKKYTFYLAKGLTFGDGTPLTKEDVLFSFEQYAKPTSPFKNAFDIIKNVDADFSKDTPTVTVTLKKFSAPFLTDLTLLYLLPKKDVEKYGDRFGDHLNGTGAFKVISYNLNQIVLEKKPHPVYNPQVKYIVFKIIKDDSTRFLNIYKGSIDIIMSALPFNKISYIEKEHKYNIYTSSGTSMNYMLLNLKDPILKNKDFRWALSLALDRNSIIKYKLEGFATSATSLLPSGNIFHNQDLKPILQDQKTARSVIEKMHLKNKEFILKTSNTPEVVDIARVIVSQLESIGLKIKLQSYEWGTYYGDIKAANYQMAIMRWTGLSDPDIYHAAFSSKEFPPGRNRSFYSNPEMDKMLDEGQEIESIPQRKTHYNKIQKIIFDEQIVIPLWYNALVDLVHKRVENYSPQENGDFSPLYKVRIKESSH